MTPTICGCDGFEPNAGTWRGRPTGLEAGAGWSESTGFLGRPTGRLGSASGLGLDFVGRPCFCLGFGVMTGKCTISNADCRCIV